jgi:hypothetical protein
LSGVALELGACCVSNLNTYPFF